VNKLDQLKSMTSVVADTGDIEAIRQYQPLDATTNPSLLLKAAALPQYANLLQQSLSKAGADQNSNAVQLASCVDHFGVGIGAEILKIIPGRISTEVDARLSFDTKATLAKARELIELYGKMGVGPERVLIKMASTWEGIQAASILEKEGINCNLTLLFGFSQAVACADAGAYLISPFVGRILDWHKANGSKTEYSTEEDPGVISVSHIYRYYKQHNYNTVVMGASFRNTGEIEQLAGCDRLTISPGLLEELANDNGTIERKLIAGQDSGITERVQENEAQFRLGLNEDAMSTEKLSEGIRNFIKDQRTLETQFAALAKAQ